MGNGNTPSTYSGFPNGLISRGVPILDLYPGKVFWVDSVNGSNGNRGTSQRPFASIAFLYDNAATLGFTDGDKVICKNGHVEAVIAAGGLDLDIAGTAILFLGEGANRAQINFTTDVAADMDIDAGNITLINPLFIAGIDALAGPIDVNDTDFTIIGGEYRDAAGIDTTDALVAGITADNMIIDGWTYVRGDELGTQKQSHIQINAATNVKLNNIDITGDFNTAPIENTVAAWIDANLTNLLINNKNTGPQIAISLRATSTGWIKNASLRIASGSQFLTASTMQFDNVKGTGVDGGTATEIGAGAGPKKTGGGLVFSGTNTATTTTTTPVIPELGGFGNDYFNDSHFMFVVQDAGGASAAPEGQYRIISDYVSDTATFTTRPFAASIDVGDEMLVQHKDLVNPPNNTSYTGVNTAASTTAPVVDKLAGFGDDYFNNEWYMRVIFDAGVANAAPESETRLITNYVSSTGGFVVDAFGTAVADGDVVTVVHKTLVEGFDVGDKGTIGSDAVMVNGDTIFTIAGGPIEVLALVSQCITNNDATASTLQYNCTATVGGAVTFSGASASLASVTAGEAVVLNGTALSTAPDVTVAALVSLTGVHTRGILLDSGVVTVVIGVGSTTGTWRHHLRWRPLRPGVTVIGT